MTLNLILRVPPSLTHISHFSNDEADKQCHTEEAPDILFLSLYFDSWTLARASASFLALGPATIALASTTSTKETLSLPRIS
jgi:hypothetical protein